MRSLVAKLLVTAGALWAAIAIVPGFDFDGSAWAFVGVTLLMVIAGMIVKPIINLFSLPLIFLTFGLFLLITNAIVLQVVVWLSGDVFSLGLTSKAFFWSTFLAAVVVSLARFVLEKILN